MDITRAAKRITDYFTNRNKDHWRRKQVYARVRKILKEEKEKSTKEWKNTRRDTFTQKGIGK